MREVGGVFAICRPAILAKILPVVATCARPGPVRMSTVGLSRSRFHHTTNIYDVLGARVAGVTTTFNAIIDEHWFLSTSIWSRLVAM